jgi:hypothetical protein
VKRIDRAVAAVIAVSAWAGIVLVAVPGRASLVGHTWLVLVLAIALGAALGTLRRSVPRRPSAFDVHYRLRPSLRVVASGLLLRRGVDLERSPERARELVGADVWELIRPDRPAPDDRAAPGLPLATVERAVGDLERLAWS